MQKIIKYILPIALSLFVITTCGNSLAYAANDDGLTKEEKDKYSITGFLTDQAGKDKIQEKVNDVRADKDPEYREQRKQEQTRESKKSSYAKILFKNSDRNGKLMYYNKQTGAKVDTVESKIKKQTSNPEEATKYATFLYSLKEWNLYNVSSDYASEFLHYMGAFFKFFYGGLLVVAFYILKIIEALKNYLADFIDYLNVFRYLKDENGSIPKNSPFYFMNALLPYWDKMTTFAKIMIALFIGWIAFRLASGIGKAKMRGNYFKNKGLKVLYALLSMILAATVAYMSLSFTSDMLKGSDGVSTSALEKIPKSMLVDTNQYIDNSLSKIDGKKGSDGTNDGYVLNHDKGFPTTPKEVATKVPTKELVEYMNTNDDKDKAEKLDGKKLLKDWAFSSRVNSNDVQTMYHLSKEGGDNMNYLNFKLVPMSDGVKLSGGKELFGTELKNAEISSSSLVGNSAIGVALNGLKLGIMILSITWVIMILYWAVFMGIASAVKDFFVNVSFSQMGMYQAFFGVIITAIILPLGVGLTLILIDQFPTAVVNTDDWLTKTMNNDNNFNGATKQVLQTILLLFLLFIISGLVFKIRIGVLQFIKSWFNYILDAMNPEGTIAGGSNRDKEALENAFNSHMAGSEAGLAFAGDPYGTTRDGLGLDGAKDRVKSLASMMKKDEEKDESLDSMMKKDGEDGSEETSSEFAGSASSTQSDGDDVEEHGDEIEQDINEGLKKLEDTSEDGMINNLNDQEKSLENASDEFGKLNDTQQEVDNAQNELEQLQASGASGEEIALAEQKVADAERAHNNQLGRAQEANRLLTKNGVGLDDAITSKTQAMNDLNEANDEVETAEQQIANLTEEKETMAASGASDKQLQGMDERINRVKDGLATSKMKQQLAKQASEAHIKNPEKEQELRNDIIEDHESKKVAENNLSEAALNGNLNEEEYTKLQRAATSLGDDINVMKRDIDNQIDNNVAKKGMVEFMQSNGGQAFKDSTYTIQQREMQAAEENVDNIKSQYNEALTSPSNNHIKVEELKSALSNAQTNYDNLNTVQQAMSSGKNINSAIQSQQNIMQRAYEEKEKAVQTLHQFQTEAASGNLTDRTEKAAVEGRLKNAQEVYDNGVNILSGLQAVKILGRKSMPESSLNQIKTDNNQELDSLYSKQKDVEGVQGTVSKLDKGEKVGIQETGALYQTQKQVRRKASDKVKAATDRYNHIQKEIAKLKKHEQNGVHVKHQMSRHQASLQQAKSELNNAKQKEAFISSQGFNINSAGLTMQSNLKNSIAEVDRLSEKINKDKKAHQNILKTGGLSTNQFESYKNQIHKELDEINSNVESLSEKRRKKSEELRDSVK